MKNLPRSRDHKRNGAKQNRPCSIQAKKKNHKNIHLVFLKTVVLDE